MRFATSEETADRDRPERIVEIRLGPAITGMTPLVLRRPPVVLVHGVWSDPGTWSALDPLLKRGGRFQTTLADYSQRPYDNAGPFSKNFKIIGTALARAIGLLDVDDRNKP